MHDLNKNKFMRKYMNLVIKILFAITIIFSANVNATLIDKGDWTTDDVSGLDWLDLSFTGGMNYSSVTSVYNEWEIATRSQFMDMYRQFDIGGDNSFHDNSHLSKVCAYTTGSLGQPCSDVERFVYNIASDPVLTDFRRLFGVSYDASSTGYNGYYSMGWYIEGLIQYRGGQELAKGKNYHYIDSTYNDSRTASSDGSYNRTSPDFSWFLIRNTPIISEVSEPSVLGLMVFSLLGLFRFNHTRSS
jgi:hypothetical protein